ncbi:MAG: ABC transporter permease, partial [Alkalinema sp. FL-bin-369]|nr:ABC transporter permease [Leptolyngbyaceae cyanobacterium LF-bin-369]
MARSLYRVEYLLRETLLGLRRGGWMNGAAISTVTVLLLLFGLGLQGSWQLSEFFNRYGNQLEISAYLNTGITAKEVQPLVSALPNVTAVKSVTKEEAWTKLGQELGIQDPKAAQGQLGGNPLVDELRIQADRANAVPKLAEALKAVPGIESVQYLGEAVAQITDLNENLGAASLGVIGFLTVSAIAVITTTLRLVIAARSQEVEVMRLVGATRGTIYLPFLFQGITFGLVGAVLAWGLIQALLATLGRV